MLPEAMVGDMLSDWTVTGSSTQMRSARTDDAAARTQALRRSFRPRLLSGTETGIVRTDICGSVGVGVEFAGRRTYWVVRIGIVFVEADAELEHH